MRATVKLAIVSSVMAMLFGASAALAAKAPVLPDLLVATSDATIRPRAPLPGEHVTLKATFTNSAKVKSSDVTVNLTVNGDIVYQKTFKTMTKNAHQSVAYAYAVPADATNLEYCVDLDPYGVVNEADETNNRVCRTMPVGPGTKILELGALKPSTAKPRVGQNINWMITLINSGNVRESGVVALYAGDGTTDLIATTDLKEVNPGGQAVRKISWTVPADYDVKATHRFRAVLDPDGTRPEWSKPLKEFAYDLTVRPALKK